MRSVFTPMRVTRDRVGRLIDGPRWVTRWLVLLLALPFVAGCVAPVFLPVMLASGAAGGMGANMLGDALNGSIESNPELRLQPDFAQDPDLQEELAEIRALHAGFTPAQLAAAPTAGDCTLDDPARWLIAHRMPEARVKRLADIQLAAMGPSASMWTDIPEVVMVDGSCADGTPVGAFVAVATVQTRSSFVADLVTSGIQRQRITGTFTNGMPDGLWRILSHDSHETGAHRQETVNARIERFADGAPVGRHLAQGLNDQSTTTTIIEHRGDGTATVRHYAGRLPHSTVRLAEGLRHGWLEAHAIEYVVGHPTEASRICYQHGREAPASLCGASDV